uniref:RNA helicase n=1 Tax=Parascaris univalens TaxID=6257 RepID=A0A915AN97_PARUN
MEVGSNLDEVETGPASSVKLLPIVAVVISFPLNFSSLKCNISGKRKINTNKMQCRGAIRKK